MDKAEIKAYTVKEIREKFGVSWKVWNSWLSKGDNRNKIGEPVGKTYTPRQVKVIFELFDFPE